MARLEIRRDLRSIGGFPTELLRAGTGAGRLVWFPAVGDSVTWFGPLQVRLARRLEGFAEIVAVDPPGYGASPGTLSFADLYEWSAALLRSLDEPATRTVVAGNSSGASIATAAARRTGATGLILVGWPDWRFGVPPTTDELCPADVAALETLLARSWHRPPPIPLPIALGVIERLRAPGHLAHVASFDPQIASDELRGYAGRLALIAGRSDRLVPPTAIEQTARSRPDAQLYFIDDCGHYPHRERPAELLGTLAEVVEGFLARG